MKVALPLLLLCVCWQQALGKTAATSAQADAPSKTDKRALVEGNSGLNKREQLLGSPGIVYADTKEALPDKSPPQQVYATPIPQLRKISDVLTGHGPAFPTAIANHLYSPLPIYQPLSKTSSPTTSYAVSAPVASQLAYSEHNIIYPNQQAPQLNSIQYYSQPQKIFPQHPKIYHQPRAVLGYSPPQIQQQQLQYVQQPIQYSQPQPIFYQPNYFQPQNQNNPQNTRPQIFTSTSSPLYTQNAGVIYAQPQLHVQNHGVTYAHPQQLSVQNVGVTYAQPQSLQVQPTVTNAQPQAIQVQPTVTYAQPLAPAQIQFATSHASYTAPTVVDKNQRDFNVQPINVIDKGSDVDNQDIKNEVKAQNAFSYASFSQNLGQAVGTYQPPPKNIAPKSPGANVNYIQSFVKPSGPSYFVGQPNQVLGYYQQPQQNFYQHAPQVYVQQAYQNPQVGYVQQNLPPVAPTFPPVQYFGKFAHNLFGNYGHKSF